MKGEIRLTEKDLERAVKEYCLVVVYKSGITSGETQSFKYLRDDSEVEEEFIFTYDADKVG